MSISGNDRRGRVRSERGTVSIEVVVLIPVLVLVALMTLQLGVAGWTASQAEEAARQAARAQSLGDDPRAAAEQALPGALDVDTLSSSGGEVSVRVEVPRVSILPRFSVTRSVTMPSVP